MAAINIDVGANTRRAEKDIQRLVNRSYNINLRTRGDQPLGRITGKVNEFTKSLDASNARVIAFGASAGIIFGVQRAFSALASSVIETQKSLQDINVILNVSSSELNKFGSSLFNIAKNTGQSFKEVANAATEFSRQGLGVVETLKRTNEALILSRLSGLDTVKSVEALTAAVNSFASQAVTATEVVNKFANVDAAFAVSSADLAEALQRVGSSASQSGVSLNELIAIVTAAQQTTARGGAVIGNSFKTIFTRLQRSKVVNLLEGLGVDTKDSTGQIKSTINLLQDLAKVYDQLGTLEQASVAEKVGGVFQINILKAALADLGKEYSIYNNALQIAASTTDEAVRRNEELNKTYAAQLNALRENAKQAGVGFGERLFGPAFDRVVGNANDILGGINESDGKGVGAVLGKGILDGLGQVIAGPGLALIGGIFIKLFSDLAKFATGSLKELLNLNAASKQQESLQQSVNQILQKNPELFKLMQQGTAGLNKGAEILLSSLRAQTLELQKQEAISAKIAAQFIRSGNVTVAGGVPVAKSPKTKSGGFIPNFSVQSELKGIKKSPDYTGGQKRKAAGDIRTANIPGIGPTVYNGQESIVDSQKVAIAMGYPAGTKPKNPAEKYSILTPAMQENLGFAAKGFVPNFAPANLKEIREGGIFEKQLNKYFFGTETDAGNATLDFPPNVLQKVKADEKKRIGMNPKSFFGDAKRTENRKNQRSLVSKILRTPSFQSTFFGTKPDPTGKIYLPIPGLSMLFLNEGADRASVASLGINGIDGSRSVGKQTRDVIKSYYARLGLNEKQNYTIQVPYIADQIRASSLPVLGSGKRVKNKIAPANSLGIPRGFGGRNFASGFIPNFAKASKAGTVGLGDISSNPSYKGKLISVIIPQPTKNLLKFPAQAKYLDTTYTTTGFPVSGPNRDVTKKLSQQNIPNLHKNIGKVVLDQANVFGQSLGATKFMRSVSELPNLGGVKSAAGVAFEGGVINALGQSVGSKNARVDFTSKSLNPQIKRIFNNAPGSYEAKNRPSPELINDGFSKFLRGVKPGSIKSPRSGGFKESQALRAQALKNFEKAGLKYRRGNELNSKLETEMNRIRATGGMSAGFIPNFANIQAIQNLLRPGSGATTGEMQAAQAALNRIQSNALRKLGSVDKLIKFRELLYGSKSGGGLNLDAIKRKNLNYGPLVQSAKSLGLDAKDLQLLASNPLGVQQLKSFNPNVRNRSRFLASGYIPNFAIDKAKEESINRETNAVVDRFGVSRSKAKKSVGFDTSSKLVSKENPIGGGSYSSMFGQTSLQKAMKDHRGEKLTSVGKTASSGFIPNFAPQDTEPTDLGSSIGALAAQFGFLGFALQGFGNTYRQSLTELTQKNKEAGIVTNQLVQAQRQLILEQRKTGAISKERARARFDDAPFTPGGGQKAGAAIGSVGFALTIAAPIIAETIANAIGKETKEARIGGAGASALGQVGSFAGLGALIAPNPLVGAAIGGSAGALLGLIDVIKQASTDIPELSAAAKKASENLTKINDAGQKVQTSFEQIKQLREGGQAEKAGQLEAELLSFIRKEFKDTPELVSGASTAVINQDFVSLQKVIGENTNAILKNTLAQQKNLLVGEFFENFGRFSGGETQTNRLSDIINLSDLGLEDLDKLSDITGRASKAANITTASRGRGPRTTEKAISQAFINFLESTGAAQSEIDKFKEAFSKDPTAAVRALRDLDPSVNSLKEGIEGAARNSAAGNKVIELITKTLQTVQSNYAKLAKQTQSALDLQLLGESSVRNAQKNIRASEFETKAVQEELFGITTPVGQADSKTQGELLKIEGDFANTIKDSVGETISLIGSAFLEQQRKSFDALSTIGGDDNAQKNAEANLETAAVLAEAVKQGFDIKQFSSLLDIGDPTTFTGFDVEAKLSEIAEALRITEDDPESQKRLDTIRDAINKTNQELVKNKAVLIEQKTILANQKFQESLRELITSINSAFGGLQAFISDDTSITSALDKAIANLKIIGEPTGEKGIIEVGRNLQRVVSELSKITGRNLGPELGQNSQVIQGIRQARALDIENQLTNVVRGLGGIEGDRGKEILAAFRKSLEKQAGVDPNEIAKLSGPELIKRYSETVAKQQVDAENKTGQLNQKLIDQAKLSLPPELRNLLDVNADFLSVEQIISAQFSQANNTLQQILQAIQNTQNSPDLKIAKFLQDPLRNSTLFDTRKGGDGSPVIGAGRSAIDRIAPMPKKPRAFAAGSIPPEAIPAMMAEQRDIKKGVGGARPSDRPVYRNDLGMVVSNGEKVYKNFMGTGKPAVFNRDMQRAAEGYIPNEKELQEALLRAAGINSLIQKNLGLGFEKPLGSAGEVPKVEFFDPNDPKNKGFRAWSEIYGRSAKVSFKGGEAVRLGTITNEATALTQNELPAGVTYNPSQSDEIVRQRREMGRAVGILGERGALNTKELQSQAENAYIKRLTEYADKLVQFDRNSGNQFLQTKTLNLTGADRFDQRALGLNEPGRGLIMSEFAPRVGSRAVDYAIERLSTLNSLFIEGVQRGYITKEDLISQGFAKDKNQADYIFKEINKISNLIGNTGITENSSTKQSKRPSDTKSRVDALKERFDRIQEETNKLTSGATKLTPKPVTKPTPPTGRTEAVKPSDTKSRVDALKKRFDRIQEETDKLTGGESKFKIIGGKGNKPATQINTRTGVGTLIPKAEATTQANAKFMLQSLIEAYTQALSGQEKGRPTGAKMDQKRALMAKTQEFRRLYEQGKYESLREIYEKHEQNDPVKEALNRYKAEGIDLDKGYEDAMAYARDQEALYQRARNESVIDEIVGIPKDQRSQGFINGRPTREVLAEMSEQNRDINYENAQQTSFSRTDKIQELAAAIKTTPGAAPLMYAGDDSGYDDYLKKRAEELGVKWYSKGFIPPETKSFMEEMRAGFDPNEIYQKRQPEVQGLNNPEGRATFNRPQEGNITKERMAMANRMYIPNFANSVPESFPVSISLGGITINEAQTGGKTQDYAQELSAEIEKRFGPLVTQIKGEMDQKYGRAMEMVAFAERQGKLPRVPPRSKGLA